MRGEGNDTLASWMKTFYVNAEDVKKDVLKKLVSHGVLKEVKGKFLWVFKLKNKHINCHGMAESRLEK